MENITVEKLKSIFVTKGYGWGSFNIIGIRTLDQTPDVFNDFICLVIADKLVGCWSCTTDPGVYWLKNPSRINGTAILPEGQYIDSWILGVHKTYPALTQFKPLKVWRDNNKDAKVDYTGNLYADVQGLNIHKGHDTWLSKNAKYLLGIIKVDKYSAACQVFAFSDNFATFIDYCKKSGLKLFTYTLLNEKDFS